MTLKHQTRGLFYFQVPENVSNRNAPLINTFIVPEVPEILYALFDYGLTLEHFKRDIEQQIERLKNNDGMTEGLKEATVENLDFVLGRIKLYELTNKNK